VAVDPLVRFVVQAERFIVHGGKGHRRVDGADAQLAASDNTRHPVQLAKQFADYLGVTLKITVRQNISQLFDDLDDGQADIIGELMVLMRSSPRAIIPATRFSGLPDQGIDGHRAAASKRRQPCVFSGHRPLRNLKLQKINALKKLKINYLLIVVE
jgi:hypothetical protein